MSPPPKLMQEEENGGRTVNRVAWLLLVPLLAASVALYFFDPTRHFFFPQCIFHQLTGLQCPGCGGLRATHLLLHGHVLEAMRMNAIFVLSLPILGYCVCRAAVAEFTNQRGPSFRFGSLWIKVLIAVVIAFSVFRNIPVFPFYYLSP